MSNETRRIAIGRYHDGAAKTNWGGRATSLAMASLIHEQEHLALSRPINGTYIVNEFVEPPAVPGRRRITRLLHKSAWIGKKPPKLAPLPFGEEESTAAQFLSLPEPPENIACLKELLSECDELWMNGEGDFILTDHPTLSRTMVIMAMARQLGKPVRLLNSILSVSTWIPDIPPAVQRGVGQCLASCRSVAYRDPTSLELHNQLYPEVKATWAPDALFAWGGRLALNQPEYSAPFGPDSEAIPVEVQQLLDSGLPYIVVSGSSTHHEVEQSKWRTAGTLVRAMRDNGFETVFVATDARDHWFSPLSREVGCTFVPSRVPLSAGVRVLSGARAMVSGRYHPSVLASNLGVPIVCMQSNSHKTRSLQLVMGKSNPTEHEFFEPAGLDALLADSLAAAQTEPEGRRRIVTRSEELRSQVAELIAGL